MTEREFYFELTEDIREAFLPYMTTEAKEMEIGEKVLYKCRTLIGGETIETFFAKGWTGFLCIGELNGKEFDMTLISYLKKHYPELWI